MLGGGGVQGEGLGANADADVGHVLLRLMSGGCGFWGEFVALCQKNLQLLAFDYKIIKSL